ncbi:hydroxymethylglutaryl-CoA synthase [Isoptericola dokdonensis]|jgi:hydroxymethylglutaryl-CoA synthase|nr:hydroxymethylglutaryl-CoA synthase [Isoptericola dokdonensis]
MTTTPAPGPTHEATMIGISDLSLATGHHVLDLAQLAQANGTDPAKYRVGLGQDEMSVLAPDEDVVTLAASAALPLVQRHGTDRIRTLLVATESGVDQSKSVGVWVHRLLGLPSSVRTVELKQACYAGTAGLQAALGIVARDPRQQVLVVAADVARYDVDTAAEPTQGAGAVAMLVEADPALLAIDPVSGVHTADVDDFWRPNDHASAVVDGRLSVSAYLDALTGAWDDYRAQGGHGIEEFARFCYHQPFTRMATKAHRKLAQHTGAALDEALLEPTTRYNRRLGNSYTASLWAALASLLDDPTDLTGERIGLFSYGSGAVGELVTGVVRDGYRDHLRAEDNLRVLDERKPVDLATYRALHAAAGARGSEDHDVPVATSAPFRFAGVRNLARRYEGVAGA